VDDRNDGTLGGIGSGNGRNGGGPAPLSRRRFLGYVIAAPTLVVGAPIITQAIRHKAVAADGPALSPVPTAQAVDNYDLTDLLTGATGPTSHLITITMNPDGTEPHVLIAPPMA